MARELANGQTIDTMDGIRSIRSLAYAISGLTAAAGD